MKIMERHDEIRPLIKLASDRLYYSTTSLGNPYHAEIPAGVTAIIGPNGAGKSLLGDIIARGRNFRTNRIDDPQGLTVKKVEFSDIHSLRGITSQGYYQQRFETTMNDEVPTVADVLPQHLTLSAVTESCRRLGLVDVLDKRVNYLSSGELRKLLIAVTLCELPGLLILDNPYIGLDAVSRSVLDDAIKRLVADGLSVLLLLCDPEDIPEYTTCIVPVKVMTIGAPLMVDRNINVLREELKSMFDVEFDTDAIPECPPMPARDFNTLVEFRNCVIANGCQVLLPDFNWVIKERERWSLSGPNGSGKSTILSLINADNPAGYRSDITLFDHRRGTGESIWDIKRLIGYVSPEMRLYFSGTGTLSDVIGHGLVDTVGNYVKLTESQSSHAAAWIKVLGLEDFASAPYRTLSAGQRQLALVARALIKQPRLLILDEPMHGLDYGCKRALLRLIELLCRRSDEPTAPHTMSMIYVTHYQSERPDTITHTLSL